MPSTLLRTRSKREEIRKHLITLHDGQVEQLNTFTTLHGIGCFYSANKSYCYANNLYLPKITLVLTGMIFCVR